MEKKNVGKCDRMIRIVVGIVLIVLAFNVLKGLFSALAYLVAAIVLVTGLARYCPMYRVFGCDSTKCCCKMCGSCKNENKDVSVEEEKKMQE